MKRTRITSTIAAGMQAQAVAERNRPGQPHKGRVFVAVHAHSYEVPHFAAGLCAKLIAEGYTGYVVRTSNDQLGGELTIGENVLNTQQEHAAMASALGFRDVFNLYYRHGRMNGISSTDLRGRLALIFRMVKADTVISFNPWAAGEDDPDRWVTGRAVDEASAAAAAANEYPEYLEAGLLPHAVSERYYFHSRPGQPFNRVVDVSSHVEKKIDAIVECRSHGGGGLGSAMRARLAKEGKSLPLLGNDDKTADREYVRRFLLEDCRQYGKPYKFAYAERFFHVDRRDAAKAQVEAFVEKNAVRMG